MMCAGEANGARLLAVGAAITQVGDDYQCDVTTWDLIPAGEVGDVLFRTIDVALWVDGTYQIGVTPIVDGVAQTEEVFSGAATGEIQCQAYFAVRGVRVAARVRTLSRSGLVVLHNIGASFTIIRATP